MTDSTDPLIAAAVRPVSGDAEMKSSAVRLLESLREDCPDQTAAALKRWAALSGEKRRISWRVIFHLTVAFISLLLLTQATLDFLNYRTILQFISGYSSSEFSGQLDGTRFSAREKLLLKIGADHQSLTELAKALWNSDPANPAYYSEYCSAFFSDQGKLPTDFLDQARKIDPNNAWFPYWAAAVAAKDSVKKRLLSKAARAAGAAPGWDVINEGKFDEALAILHESRNLPACRNDDIQMVRERIPLLPQGTPVEYYHSLFYLAGTITRPYFLDLPNAIAAKAWLCGERNDPLGLIALKQDTDAYLQNVLRTEAGFIVHNITTEASAKSCLKNLAASAVKLGLTGEAAEIQARLDRLDKLSSDRKTADYKIDGQNAERQLSVINDSIAYIAKRALHPPVLTDRDVKPGRMIELGVLSQVCTTATWALLGITSGLAALYRFRAPRVIRDLSARVELLLRPVDWLWLCMAGIPPFLYCLFIIHLTPLGGSDANLFAGNIDLPYFDGILLPIAQFTGLFFMMIILPILIARWRLGKRAAFFGFDKARLWSGAIAMLSAAAFIPVLGWAVTRNSEVALKLSWGLFVIPIAWILVVVIRGMTAGAAHLLHLTTAARVLVPTYSAAMVILLTAAPFYMISRQRWFEQDTMSHLDVAYPSLSKFEYQLSVAARKELREALGYE